MTEPTQQTRHWSYRLPVIVHSERGPMHWAHEAIAEHKNPEYLAWRWGYSKTEVEAAKEAINGK